MFYGAHTRMGTTCGTNAARGSSGWTRPRRYQWRLRSLEPRGASESGGSTRGRSLSPPSS